MAKISRPVVYAAVLGVAAYAVVLLTEPDAPPKKPVVKTTRSAAKTPDGFLPEDFEAKFDRAGAIRRDAFKPGIVAQKAGAGGDSGGLFSGPLAGWALTGITAVNGRRSALMENPSAQESVFLKVGDTWHGLRVAEIEPGSVLFVHTDGKQSRVAFPVPEEEKPASPVAPVVIAVPPASGAPVAPVNPVGDTGADPNAGGRRNRAGRNQ